MKILYLSILFLFLICSFSYGVPVEVQFEDSYLNGETVQGKIYTDTSFQDTIKPNDFRLESNESSVNIFPILIPFEDYTYFYFDLPNNLFGDYSFVVEDVIFDENGVLKESDFMFDFFITQSNGSIINVDYGLFFIDLEQDNYFHLAVRNPSSVSSNVTIEVEDEFVSPNLDNFVLAPGEGKVVDFYVSRFLIDRNQTNILVRFDDGDYTIPVIFENFEEIIVNIENESIVEEGTIKLLEDTLNVSIDVSESSEGFLRVSNEFGKDIDSLIFVISGDLNGVLELETEDMKNVKAGEIRKNRVYVNEAKNLEFGNYTGNISVIYENTVYDTVTISIFVQDENKNVNITVPDLPEEKGDNTLQVVLFLVVFVVLIMVLIFIKYKKSKKNSSSFLGQRLH